MACERTFSSPDRFLSRLGFWKMIPTRRRTSDGSFASSYPQMRIRPDVGARVVVRIEMVVVLPAPLGPSRAKNSPASTRRLMPSTALTFAFRYRLTRSSTSTAGASADHMLLLQRPLETRQSPVDHLVVSRERDPKPSRQLEEPAREHEDLLRGKSLREGEIIGQRRADQDVESALRGHGFITQLAQGGDHAVPAALQRGDVNTGLFEVA